MEYLHLFENLSEHDDVYYAKDGYQEPWVAYIENDNTVTYNKSALPIEPSDKKVTFISNCNSEEYAYFRSLKEKTNSQSNTEEENVIFKTKLVSHTVSEDKSTITFTYSTPTDEDGCICNDMVLTFAGYINGDEIFVDNGNGTYRQSSKWKSYKPETDQPWVPKT